MKNLLVALLTSLTACTGNLTKLPGKRPADFVLTFHFDGPMWYYSSDIHISQDSCVIRDNDGGKKTDKHFTLSAAELDKLYAFLQQKQFSRIEYEFEKGMYNQGGISIDITWNKGTKHIYVSNTRGNLVKEKWKKNWDEICYRLLEIVGK